MKKIRTIFRNKPKGLIMKKNSIYITLISIVAIYAIIGFVAVPKLLKPQIQKILNENLTQKAKLEKIEFNPFLLKLSLQNLEIYNEKETTAKIDNIYVDFAVLRSIDELHIAFKDLKLVNPYVNIIEYEDGTFNLQKLLKEKEEEKTKEETKTASSDIKFQIYRTILDNATINFTKLNEDDEPYKLNISKFDYTFYDMGTFRNILASHSLRMLINQNSELEINGGLKLAPFKMYGNIELRNIRPKEFLDYKKDLVNFDLNEDSFINLKIGYKIDTENKLDVILNDGYLALNKLNISKDEKTLTSLENFAIDNINLQYPKNNIDIDTVALNQLNLNAIIDEKGQINFSNLIASDEKNVEEVKNNEMETNDSQEESKKWIISLKNFDLKKSNIKFDDLSNKLFTKTDDLNIALKDLKIDDNDITLAKLSLSKPTITINDKKNNLSILNKELEIDANNFSFTNSNILLDEINIKNSALDFEDLKNKNTIFSKKTDLYISKINKENENINISDIKLTNPSIYFLDKKNSINVVANSNTITAKNFSLNGNDISLDETRLTIPTIKFNDKKSKMNVTTKSLNLSAFNTTLKEEKLNIKTIRLAKPSVYLVDNKNNQNIVAKNININVNKISFDNNNLKIQSSNINKPYVSITLGKKEESKEKEVEEKTVKKVSKQKSDFKFDVGPVKIQNMKMTFEDKNLPIPFKTNIDELKGSFSRLNSSNSKPTKLQLEGKVDKYGYTKIVGTVDINDIKLLTDTNLLFKNIAIKNFTPYSGKFVGRKIDSGKLNLDLKYNIKKSDLNAQNSVIISDIQLGEKVESPDAVNLPLELAIALLEDSDGIIDIDLPISGNVDDPQFSIAPIVWKVFTNLIVKAITSPFALLGAMLGIDEEKIKSMDFEFGKSDIIPSEKETLDSIAKLLAKKPKLAIKIKPIYNPQKDKKALQDIKFEQFVLKRMEKIPQGDDYKEALEEFYNELKDVKELDKIKETYYKKDKNGKEYFETDRYTEYLRSFLASKQNVSEKELISITEKRIDNIKNYLFNIKQVSKESIIIDDITKQEDEKNKWAVFNFDVSTK
jgi:outer membrane protein OmpA-like peptidoglycan-associated protein